MTSGRASIGWNATAAGTVSLVTGGAGGIGSSCAEAFVRAGGSVVVTDVADGSELASRLDRQGPGRCRFVHCDLNDRKSLRRLVDDVAKDEGRIDCLINNAARFLRARPIDDVTDDDFDALWRVNVASYFVAAQAALPYLRATRGSIVNVSSIVGSVGQWRDSAYAATKGAVTALTVTLALEEAASGVRVNGVAPGVVATPAFDDALQEVAQPEALTAFMHRFQWLGRVGTPAEVASVCLFLASEAATFITGLVLPVTGGAELGLGPREPYPDFGRLT